MSVNIYQTTINQPKLGAKLTKLLLNVADKTNDKPYENQPHQNIIDPDLHLLEFDCDEDDTVYCKQLCEKYPKRNEYHVCWPTAANWHEDLDLPGVRVPEYNYRMCPAVIEISINPKTMIRKYYYTKKTKKYKRMNAKKNREFYYEFNEYDFHSYIVKFISPIFGIPQQFIKHSPIVLYLEKVFQEMFPYIAKILDIDVTEYFDIYQTQAKNGDIKLQSNVLRLQVIVKSQIYNIENDKFFYGKWHLDGAVERVQCICTWYYKVDQSLAGGELHFDASYIDYGMGSSNYCLQTKTPQDLAKYDNGLYNEDTDDRDHDQDDKLPTLLKQQVEAEEDDDEPSNAYKYMKLDINENDVIIWDQTGLVHRVANLYVGESKNKTKQQLSLENSTIAMRGFLNFFIVDDAFALPRDSLKWCDPCDFSGENKKALILSVIYSAERVLNAHGNFSLEMATLIVEYGYVFRTKEESAKIRSAAMKARNNSGEFEKYFSGNSGTYGFVWDWLNCNDDYCP